MDTLRGKLRQYSCKNLLIRIAKSLLRRIGFVYENFIVLERQLDARLIPIKPRIEIESRDLNLVDFENARDLNISESMLKLIKKRFENGDYISMGAFYGNELVYFCWISLRTFECSLDLVDTLAFGKYEALLLNAFTHPDYRGYGIHTYMNAVRLNKLIDLNKKKAMVLVLSENTPALKSQIKVGFRAVKVICYRKLFGKLYIKERIYQKE